MTFLELGSWRTLLTMETYGTDHILTTDTLILASHR